jgi:XRE family aerobic/anaerobic benzoate catabolism transcriptional regulator
LAETAGVSERYLNELENGNANASIGILVRVAGALETGLVDLIAPTSSGTAAARSVAGPLGELVAGMSPREQAGARPILEHYLAERRKALKGVALLGLRGAGKTTIGGLFAKRHQMPFISITREIEVHAGMSLADLFNLGGAEAYRALENEVVGEIARRKDPVVLETAGGIVGNAEALDVILASFKTVWLRAAPEEHLARVAGQGDTRPMRGNPKAIEHLKSLLAQREGEYARAECVLDTSGKTAEACVEELERIAAPMLAKAA